MGTEGVSEDTGKGGREYLRTQDRNQKEMAMGYMSVSQAVTGLSRHQKTR